MGKRYDIAVLGSGFAGSILARALRARGRSVLLLERARHPRFALGESSTPLAAVALERLSRRYGLRDLHHLAAWGRWKAHLSAVGCGRKRGFSFYRHRPGMPFSCSPMNEARLLVAASPEDAVADTHWVRSDVDAFLVERARREGVEYFDGVAIESVAIDGRGVELRGTMEEAETTFHCAVVVDGTGPAGVVPRALGHGEGAPIHTCSGLVYAHLAQLPEFDAVAGLAALGPTPYPADWAAVHHLVDEGWIYQLRFDSGLVSVGLCVRGGLPPKLDPQAVWGAMLARHPTLADQYQVARFVRPLALVPRMQHRRACAAGGRWLALPHTYAFFDPLFSTGIAWSLRGVERIAGLLAEGDLDAGEIADGRAFARYAELLAGEADQIDRLVAGAYLTMRDFGLFAAYSMLYFATVSFAEARQRLLDPPDAAWEGFLGADDPAWSRLFAEALSWLERLGSRRPSAADVGAFEAWVGAGIAPRNVAGLADPARRNLYPVDLDALLAAHERLGLTRDQARAALPRLRGAA